MSTSTEERNMKPDMGSLMDNILQMDQFLRLSRVPTDLVKYIQVEEPTPELKDLMGLIEMKMCFNNTARLVMHLGEEARYCLGYAAGIIPVEHAWLKLDDKYYDLTWNKYSTHGHTYASMFELTRAELFELIDKNEFCPPSLWDMHRLGQYTLNEHIEVTGA
jgi:hypothetical protein